MNPPRHPSVYLAGPLGFTESGRQYQEAKIKPALSDFGFLALDPWPYAEERFALAAASQEPDRIAALEAANSDVGRENERLLRTCSCVLAILDGSDVDSGTASEIGFAAALPRPVVGLRTDLRMAGDNAATPINLQVLHFLSLSGGVFVTDLNRAVQELLRLCPPKSD
jgi:nucleoside 2-deoxyribosyltransferase